MRVKSKEGIEWEVWGNGGAWEFALCGVVLGGALVLDCIRNFGGGNLRFGLSYGLVQTASARRRVLGVGQWP